LIKAPFDMDHVDAHADHGLGDSSWVYLLTEILALPVGTTRPAETRLGWAQLWELLGICPRESMGKISDIRIWPRHSEVGRFPK
jgi:hypothetical protein